MRQKFILIALLMLSAATSFGQKPVYKTLAVGDTIPDLDLKYRVGNEEKAINTRSFRGKLVILDFWNIWCSTCISAMPEMERLQQQFIGELMIMAVTKNSQKQINEQFSKIAARTPQTGRQVSIPPSLPSIVSDSILNKLFPHQSVPHHIWIDKAGKIKFIAAGYDATYQRIKDVLAGNEVKMAEKLDREKFDFKTPLYKEGSGRQMKNLKAYSMLFKEAREYLNSHIEREVDTIRKTYRNTYYNFTILNMYQEATVEKYGRTFYSPLRISLEVADPSKFHWPKDQSKIGLWRLDNLYCYEINVPLENKDEMGTRIIQDLNRFLPYKGIIEKRNTKYLAVIKIDNERQILKKQLAFQKVQIPEGQLGRSRGTINTLMVNNLYHLPRLYNLPLIDETGYNAEISVFLSSKGDLATTRKDLRKAGFDIIEKTHDIEFLVIKDH